MYTTTDKCRSFSGEIETEKDIVLIDGVTCQHLPFEVVRRDLNKDMLFCSSKVLAEYLTLLNQD